MNKNALALLFNNTYKVLSVKLIDNNKYYFYYKEIGLAYAFNHETDKIDEIFITQTE